MANSIVRPEQRRASTAPSDTDELELLLDEIAEIGSLPLEEAVALPPRAYLNLALYELELQRLWRRSWLYAGRVEEIPHAGDWISVEFAGEPIVVTRGVDGVIRALSRVCAHRFMDVLPEDAGRQGNADAFVCPYHSWSYSLTGELIGAPLMSGSKRFERDQHRYCLPSFRVTTWEGFIFVNLDGDAEDLIGSTALREIERLMGNYRGSEWRLVSQIAWGGCEANWKLAMDNGREPYHHQGTHRKTLEPLWPAHGCQVEATAAVDTFGLHMFVSPEAAVGREDGHYLNPTVVPAAPGLTAFERSQYLITALYPSFIVAPGPDAILTLRILPTGPTSHTMDLGILMHESRLDEPNIKQAIAEMHDWFGEVQGEDAVALATVQRMLATKAVHRGGALSPLEQSVWNFERYLASRLTDADIPDIPS
jgi:phenylpropionate dioxygenase-like ring-hydroxylating dioxygenase large terminal subunit